MKCNIWYCKPEFARVFRFGVAGIKRIKQDGCNLPTAASIQRTHVLLKTIEASCAGEAWQLMQGEFWSPNGEANAMISELGLDHTSMSVGDVVEIGGVFSMVEMTGFAVLGS